MPRGTVSNFNERGNYGFITVDEAADTDDEDEGVDDVFFHMADVSGPDLAEGQDVEFDIEQSDKGPRANNLTRLDEDGEPVEFEQQGMRNDDVLVDEDGNEWVSIHDM